MSALSKSNQLLKFSVWSFKMSTTDGVDLDRIKAAEGSKSELHKMIENTSFSADSKYYLHKILDCSVSFGKTIVNIGRAVLGIVSAIYKRFPGTTISIVLARFLPLILSSGIVSQSVGKSISALLPLLGLKQDFDTIVLGKGFEEALKDNASMFFSAFKTV